MLSSLIAGAALAQPIPPAPASCERPLYLSFDTGHMGVAPLVAEVLQRQQVRVTFFAAAERTQSGGHSLDDQWAPWWAARAAEGHAFASHTLHHDYWVRDEAATPPRFAIRASAGPLAGKTQSWSAQQYCQSIQQASNRLAQITGAKPLPLWRAPGGKTSASLIAAAQSCGYKHVGWSANGFLGDELPSDKYPNDKLLKQALARVQAGDILLAHLGIWSRKDPWAPAVLEPLLQGLKAKGFCFRTLNEHPAYSAWVASRP